MNANKIKLKTILTDTLEPFELDVSFVVKLSIISLRIKTKKTSPIKEIFYLERQDILSGYIISSCF